MGNQLNELKQHIIIVDDLVSGHAARIPSEVVAKIKKHLHGGLAIIVSAEALRGTDLERRSLFPQEHSKPFVDIVSDDIAPDDYPPRNSYEGAGTIDTAASTEPKFERTDIDHVWKRTDINGIERFHYSDEAEQINPISYGTKEMAKESLDDYVLNHLHQPTDGKAELWEKTEFDGVFRDKDTNLFHFVDAKGSYGEHGATTAAIADQWRGEYLAERAAKATNSTAQADPAPAKGKGGKVKP